MSQSTLQSLTFLYFLKCRKNGDHASSLHHKYIQRKKYYCAPSIPDFEVFFSSGTLNFALEIFKTTALGHVRFV